ncbi:hypothetical protein ACFL6I_19130 [candidate division KSB1 bacterium]
MASAVALEPHPFPNQEVYDFPQKSGRVISLAARRKEEILKSRKTLSELTEADLQLLSEPTEPKRTIDLDGEEFSIVANGHCETKNIEQDALPVAERHNLETLVDEHVELPDEPYEEAVVNAKAGALGKLKYLTRVFVATLLCQNPPQPISVEKIKQKPKKSYRVTLQQIKEKLGLTGEETLLFPSDGIMNILGGIDFEENRTIHLNKGNASCEKDGEFFPFGAVKEMLVVR